MAKRRKIKLPFNRRKIIRPIRRTAWFIWRGIRFFWRQKLIYNIVFFAIAIFIFTILLSQALKPFFNCNYLIRESLNVPAFFCEGADFTVVKIPGLNTLMNGPLELIRQGIIWVILVVFVALSGYLTFVINNLKKVVKLLKLDKSEWRGLLSVFRIFVTILVVLNVLFFILVMF